MKGKHTHLDTKLIHAGEPKPLIEGAVSIPLSVGLEATEDLMEDFERTLDGM